MSAVSNELHVGPTWFQVSSNQIDVDHRGGLLCSPLTIGQWKQVM